MKQPQHRSPSLQGRDLISLAQKLARDAERHALLSASLERQADRLMVAGLEQLKRSACRIDGCTSGIRPRSS
jgi:hypothetical protein